MKTQWWKRLGVVLALALAMCCTLTTATAQVADLNAIGKRVSEFNAAGDYAAALVEARKLEAVVKARFGVNHTNYAVALTALGDAYQMQGKYAEAAELYQRALAIRRKALGSSHPDVAASLINLANAYGPQGKYREAAEFSQRALGIWERALGPSHPKVAGALFTLGNAYQSEAKYGEAANLYQRALAIREKTLGSSHPDVGKSLAQLASVYQSQGKYGEAAEFSQRALAIREKALGSKHPEVADSLNNLAGLYQSQGKYAEAAELSERALAILEKALGPNHLRVAAALHVLALIRHSQGKYAEAGDLYQRALMIADKAGGLTDRATAQAHRHLANILTSQGKYGEAAALLQRALPTLEKGFGSSHAEVGHALNSLALVYVRQGKYAEAAALQQRALAIYEKVLDPKEIAGSLNNLALVYEGQGKYAEAAGLFQRALAIKEKALGTGHPDVASALNNLAMAYSSQGKYAEAAGLYQRALAIGEKALGPNHPDVALTLINVAALYQKERKAGEAAEFLRRALAVQEKALSPNHPDLAASLHNLAWAYASQGKYGEALEFYQRALAIREKALGPNHPDVAATLYNLAIAYHFAGKGDLALASSRKVSAAIIGHILNGDTEGQRSSADGGLIEQRANYFLFHVANLAAESRTGLEPSPQLGREAFEIAQWAAQSTAGAAVQQMALRFASGTNALAALVRDNQDLAAARRGLDKALIAALSKPESKQDQATLDGLRQQIAETESKLTANAARLDKEFPDYAALANPKPLSVEEAQKLVGADEALLFILPGDTESYIFALTREAFDWKTIPLGKSALSEKVAAFRKGLDVNKLESFDLGLAQELYAALLGPVEALIKDKKHLLVAASGPLTALPFHLLVTVKPADAAPDRDRRAAYHNAAWLVKRHAVSVLPAVTSLKALRLFAHKDQGAKPMIGFGDPVFNPDETLTPGAAVKQRGSAKSRIKTASRATRAYSGVWNGAEIDYKALAKLARLDDTADELKAVRLALGAPASDIHIGKDASETTVKRVPLADYRVVYFATHAAVAGQVKGLGEPLLVLTVPKQPTEIDDGVLTASEVAQLKLNADWVVLAACNTDAGDKEGAEALSGLARAFFYAGARALLVSHWEVDSDAAAKLNISTFDILKADPSLGRAEAVRRAMLAYMNDASKPSQAYPALWGAFSVVGEGAAR